jgi:glycosyltransferase involved in cell wall biosynthesis
MRDTRPTFIIISPGFAVDEKDSTCLPLQQNLIKAINKNFPSIKIIIVALQYPFIKSEYEWYGNKVISFGARTQGKLYTLLLWIRTWIYLKKINKENNVKGILSFWAGECALIGNRFGKKYNIKHRCWILGQDARKENKHVKRMKPQPDELVALSDFIAEEFNRNHHILPAHIITPGIDPAQFTKNVPERNIDVLGVGSLLPLKQYEIFIQVIATLKEKFPFINTVISGCGPEEEKLKMLIAKYKVEKNIVLIGEIPHEEVLLLMKRSKIFLHPSNYEGFGVVCIEALYAGAHVISFSKPMNAAIDQWHIVTNEIGMLGQSVGLLQDEHIEYRQVLFSSMDNCAMKMVKLFGDF